MALDPTLARSFEAVSAHTARCLRDQAVAFAFLSPQSASSTIFFLVSLTQSFSQVIFHFKYNPDLLIRSLVTKKKYKTPIRGCLPESLEDPETSWCLFLGL